MDDQPMSSDVPVEPPKPDDPSKRVRWAANLSVGLALGAILLIGLLILLSSVVSFGSSFFSVLFLMLPLANIIGVGAAISGSSKKPYRTRSLIAFVLHVLMLVLMVCTLLGPAIGGGNTAD